MTEQGGSTIDLLVGKWPLRTTLQIVSLIWQSFQLLYTPALFSKIEHTSPKRNLFVLNKYHYVSVSTHKKYGEAS